MGGSLSSLIRLLPPAEHQNGAVSTLNANYAPASEILSDEHQRQGGHRVHICLHFLKHGANAPVAAPYTRNVTFAEELKGICRRRSRLLPDGNKRRLCHIPGRGYPVGTSGQPGQNYRHFIARLSGSAGQRRNGPGAVAPGANRAPKPLLTFEPCGGLYSIT